MRLYCPSKIIPEQACRIMDDSHRLLVMVISSVKCPLFLSQWLYSKQLFRFVWFCSTTFCAVCLRIMVGWSVRWREACLCISIYLCTSPHSKDCKRITFRNQLLHKYTCTNAIVMGNLNNVTLKSIDCPSALAGVFTPISCLMLSIFTQVMQLIKINLEYRRRR